MQTCLPARPCSIALAVALGSLLAPGWARAGDPTFKFAKAEEVKAPKTEWKAVGKAGMVVTGGNSRSTSFSGGLSAHRKAGNNKVSLDFEAAYVRSSVVDGVDKNTNGTIDNSDEVVRSSKSTTNQWLTKLRYDRFLTANNTLYATGVVGADPPAGKELFGGAQGGYSRQLYESKAQLLKVEAGYDFTYEDYVSNADSLSIHSGRLFAGYNLKIHEAASFFTSIEALANLTKETAPKEDGSTDVKPFEDTRLNWKTGISTVLWKNFTFAFDFTLKYDNVPAPLSPFKIPFAAGFVPVADKIDTTFQASLVVNFI